MESKAETLELLDPRTVPFLMGLIRKWRAQDTHGIWDKRTDSELLAPYVVTREQRRAIPVVGDPSPALLWRVELFYDAIGLALEQSTGHMVVPLLKLHREGFGRLVMTANRLVVYTRQLRDVHRFGFESLGHLNCEAEAIIATAKQVMARFPEVVEYEG